MTNPTEGAMPPLPCPFCGCADVLIKRRKTTMVECKGCGVVVFDYQDGVQRNPVEVWNRRTPAAAPLLARVAELQAALELVLPMANGYAKAHNVGSNQAYCDQADAALASNKEQP